MKLRPVLLTAVCALAIGAGCWHLTKSWLDGQGGETVWGTVKTVTEGRAVSEVGVLEPKELARIQAGIEGTVAEVAEDGSRVEAGDLVLRIDDEEIRNQLEQERMQLEQKLEELDNEKTAYSVLTNRYEAVSRKEIAEWKHAELKLEKGLIPLTPAERRQREIDIELAQLDLEDKTERLERAEELVEKAFAPESSLETPRRERDAAETFYQEKKVQLTLAGQPLPEEEQLTLQSERDKARDVVRRSEKRHQQDVAIQNLKLKRLHTEIENRRDRISRLEEDLNRVVHTAPVGGVLRMTRNFSWSSRSWQPISIGKKVWRRNIVGTIVDPNQLSLRVLVHESDRKWIKTGQPATIILRAYPSEILEGTVVEVTSLGQDRDELSPVYQQAPPMQQAMFLARIQVDVGERPTMPGMTANVRIEVGGAEPRLVVSREALDQVEPPFEVVRRRDGQTETVPVTGTFDSEGRFVVASGLREGDEVRLTGDPYPEPAP